jgi:hypothetical protein
MVAALVLACVSPSRADVRLGSAVVGARGADFGVVRIGLEALGRGAPIALEGSVVRAVHGEAHIERAPGVVEWWREVLGGLEQGVTIAARPSGEGPLVLAMATNAIARDSIDGVRLLDEHGVAIAGYTQLAVIDARGERIRATMHADGSHIRITVDDEGARYPIVVDPFTYMLEQALPPTTTGGVLAVDMTPDGTRVVYADITASEARVWVRTGTSWAQETVVTWAMPTTQAQVGSVSISSDGATIAIGDPSGRGTVFVYTRSGSTWTVASAPTQGFGGTGGFGTCVALSGDGMRMVVLGIGTTPHSGLYLRGATGWTRELILSGTVACAIDELGQEVVTIDAHNLYTWGRTAGSTTWSSAVTTAVPIQSGAGQSLASLDLDAAGTNLIVGDTQGGVGGLGIAYTFQGSGSGLGWAAAVALPQGGAGYRQQGTSVAISGDGLRAFVGAPGMAYQSVTPWSWGGTGVVFGYLRAPSGAFASAGQAMSGVVNSGYGHAVATNLHGTRIAVGETNYGTFGGAVDVQTVTSPNGTVCDATWSPINCDSGYCVDGVCCEQACGGGVANDCMACDDNDTHLGDGLCRALFNATAVTCRVSGDCELSSTCEVNNTTCPHHYQAPGTLCGTGTVAGSCSQPGMCNSTGTCLAPGVAAAGTHCASPSLPCVLGGTCDGTSLNCQMMYAPTTTLCGGMSGGVCAAHDHCDGAGSCVQGYVSGVVCRPANGGCDIAESCSGASVNCPPDAYEGPGTVCRASSMACDPAESCDGSSAMCPADVNPCGTQPDVGAYDAGSVGVDVGASGVDAGSADVGNAGIDASSRGDASTAPAPVGGSCACGVGGSRGVPWMLGLLLLVLRRRARSA